MTGLGIRRNTGNIGVRKLWRNLAGLRHCNKSKHPNLQGPRKKILCRREKMTACCVDIACLNSFSSAMWHVSLTASHIRSFTY
jgi:hypothetical protein